MSMSKDTSTKTSTDEWLEQLETDDTVNAAPADDLRRIGQAMIGVDRADAALVDAVRVARRSGRSWTEIANVLGVSRQAARQRFDAAVRASRVPLRTEPMTEDDKLLIAERFVMMMHLIPAEAERPIEESLAAIEAGEDMNAQIQAQARRLVDDEVLDWGDLERVLNATTAEELKDLNP